jgi:predicted aminopeptidase
MRCAASSARSSRRARFASRELGLPDNRSYTTYVDVGRPFVVWNVVATPEFSVEPLQWCFPVVGCLQYRGYFREAAARRYGERTAEAGHDVALGGVTAYSTLGRFADPVLSSMLRYGELDVIGTLFHELAHQQVYLPGDSSFNEAFAVTVEQEGLARWLRARGREAGVRRVPAAARGAGGVRGAAARRRASGSPRSTRARPGRCCGAPRRQGSACSANSRPELRALQQRLGPRRGAGIGAWIERGLNNAQLASVATYWDCVGGFEQVLAEQGGQLPAFYAEVRRLSRSCRPPASFAPLPDAVPPIACRRQPSPRRCADRASGRGAALGRWCRRRPAEARSAAPGGLTRRGGRSAGSAGSARRCCRRRDSRARSRRARRAGCRGARSRPRGRRCRPIASGSCRSRTAGPARSP